MALRSHLKAARRGCVCRGAARWREAATVFGFLSYPRMLMRGNNLPHAVLRDVGGCEKKGAESYSGVVVGLALVPLPVRAGVW